MKYDPTNPPQSIKSIIATIRNSWESEAFFVYKQWIIDAVEAKAKEGNAAMLQHSKAVRVRETKTLREQRNREWCRKFLKPGMMVIVSGTRSNGFRMIDVIDGNNIKGWRMDYNYKTGQRVKSDVYTSNDMGKVTKVLINDKWFSLVELTKPD